ncbi:MAG: isoprenylcysteine carboxylmethyltransferase family protein [archaeon]|nr:isoprenylcysteine carboxylmethyltransferase family protein [archaeon]
MNKIKTHEHRKDLAGEHPSGDTGQIILLILFIAGLLIDKLILHTSILPPQSFPFHLRILVSLPFFISSFLLAKSSHKTVFAEQRKELSVIKSGAFSIVRHPLYLSCILLYAGFIIISLSTIAFSIWLIILIFYYYISQYEEKILIDKLGSKYKQYMNEVPMFIPRPFRKKR